MTIGELAQQAGVSTRTLRFWADEGLIPCDRTVTGYRSFGADALPVAGLIRVLREVDVDLPTIRSILEGRRDLAAVVATHVDVIDARITQLRFQRSVLRAVASTKEPTTQELQIMYDLATSPPTSTGRSSPTWSTRPSPASTTPARSPRRCDGDPDLPEQPVTRAGRGLGRAGAAGAGSRIPGAAPRHGRCRRRRPTTGRERRRPGHSRGRARGPERRSRLAAGERHRRARHRPGHRPGRAGHELERFTAARVDRYWALLLAVINRWPAWPSQVPAFEWFIAALRA